MSRSKKSRKPGRITTGPKEPKVEAVIKEQRIRKKTGNKAGTRQQVANPKLNDGSNEAAKDPRIGSKKPIDLGIAIKPVKAKAKPVKDNRPSVAPITVIDNSQLWEEELIAIENDIDLQMLADRVEAGEEVTEEESNHLEKSLQRYQELIAKLGLQSDDSEQQESNKPSFETDDDFLDKLDDADFSEYTD